MSGYLTPIIGAVIVGALLFGCVAMLARAAERMLRLAIDAQRKQERADDLAALAVEVQEAREIATEARNTVHQAGLAKALGGRQR